MNSFFGGNSSWFFCGRSSYQLFLESLTVPGKNKHCESDRSYGIEGKEDVETNQERREDSLSLKSI